MVVRKAGATEWLNSSSGGSGVFTVVASSGGDYETVSAALAAGASDIYVQTNITETADGAFSDDTRIWLAPQITWDLTDNTFTGAASIDIEIIGAPGATLEYARATLTQPFTGFSTTSYKFRELKIFNFSTSDQTYIVSFSANQFFENIELTPAEQNLSGIWMSGVDFSIDNLEITHNSSSTQALRIDTSDGQATNIYYTGDVPVGTVSLLNVNGTITGVRIDSTSAGDLTKVFFMNSTDSVANVFIEEAATLRIATPTISNIEASSAQLYIDSNFGLVSNCNISSHNGSGVSASVHFSNCRFTAANTTVFDGENYSNCIFESGVTVDSNNVVISSSKVGSAAGGTANTVTLNSGVTGAIVIGNLLDSALVDSGATSPQITANQVY